MADYSETLWNEFRHGKDAGDQHIQENRQTYLGNPLDYGKNLVRFHYADKEEVFDNVSYPKGGSILHMLRNYVGDSAFFKSLNKYLTDNKFKSAEAHNLRLAFEDVTGQDLNWFWNQWYYGSGHPKLNISYQYGSGKSMVIVEQQQNTGKIFKLPIAIDIYNGSSKVRNKVWINNKIDTFTFNTPTKPDLINVDADKILLVDKKDNKTAANFIHQWKYAPNYLDRREALDYFSTNNMAELAQGLNDKYHTLRLFTLEKLLSKKSLLTPEVLTKVESVVNNDEYKLNRAAALEILVNQNDKKYLPLFTRLTNDSSYSVAGTALEGIAKLDPTTAKEISTKLKGDAKGKLGQQITSIIASNATEDDFDFLLSQYKNAPPTQQKLTESATFGKYLATLKNQDHVRSGVKELMVFRNQIPSQFRNFTDPTFKKTFDTISKSQRSAGNNELANYIDSLLK